MRRTTRDRVMTRCACGRRMWPGGYVCDVCFKEGQGLAPGTVRSKRALGTYPHVRVVSSPDPSMPRGAEFAAGEFGFVRVGTNAGNNLLEAGYCPPGMVVQYKGALYRVEGEVETRQRAVPISLKAQGS